MARLTTSDISAMCRRRLRAATAIGAAVLSLASGCNTSGCLDNQSAIPLAEFYSSTTGEVASLNVLRIHGVGAPADSAILKPGSAVSQVYLPMRSTAQSTKWCIAYSSEGLDDPSMNDTVALGYTSIPFFASEECGAMFYYRLTDIRHTVHLIDSVVAVDSLITNADRVSLKIYFRTSEPDDNPDLTI